MRASPTQVEESMNELIVSMLASTALAAGGACSAESGTIAGPMAGSNHANDAQSATAPPTITPAANDQPLRFESAMAQHTPAAGDRGHR